MSSFLGYLPMKDAELLTWSGTFSSLISATPTAFGLVAAQATAYAAAVAPETRGGSTVYAKDQAKVNLVKSTRSLVKQIQGTPTVTNQQRYDLGINVPKVRQQIPPPAMAPQIVVKGVDGNKVRLWLRNPADGRRRKPAGVQGLFLYSYVGTTPPADPTAWKAEGGTTQTDILVEFPLDAEPFSKVWITAQYYNPRSQTGPATTPVSTNLGTWLVQNVQAQEPKPMKAAA